MAFLIIPFITTAVSWLGRIALAVFAVNEVKKLTAPQKEAMAASVVQAEAAGFSEDEQKKLIAATTYEKVEEGGQNPDDFWAGLSPAEQEGLKYSPAVLKEAMGRTSFLGIAQTVLWVAAGVVAGIAAFRGLPAVSKGLGNLVAARRAGASAGLLLTHIEEMKAVILQKVWVPGFIASLAAAGGWFTGLLANNMNDAFLWGRIFLDQAHTDVEKAAAQAEKSKLQAGTSADAALVPRTIIRMVEEKTPEQFIGTLFSAKLGSMESFNRHVDDEITDEADLLEDVKLNLNRWLSSLLGRLGYSIVIRKDPVDEFGVKQSGIWATLTTHMTRLSGPIQPIDTILLGPMSPVTRLKLSKVTKTIESQIPKLLTAQEIRQIEVPGGSVDLFNTEGERVDLSTAQRAAVAEVEKAFAPAASTATPSPASAPSPQPVVAGVVEPPAIPKQGDVPPSSTVPVRPPARTIPADVQAVQWGSSPSADSDGTVCAQICGLTLPGLDVRQHQVMRVKTNGSCLNLRISAGTSGSVIECLPDGVLLRINNSRGQRDGFTWFDVSIPRQPGRDISRAGIVASQFLEKV